MTIVIENPTFAQTVAQTLIIRGLGFTFFDNPDHPNGRYHFAVQSDQAADLIRSLAERWSVLVYEQH